MHSRTIPALMLLFIGIGAHAAVIEVPKDYPTIQAAIDQANHGDQILVSPGTYVENLDFMSKRIHVKSVQGPAATVIDGNRGGSVVVFKNLETEDSVLEGFTVTNGSGEPITSPFGTHYYGGGIYCETGSPTIRNNIITKNDAQGGGGIFLYWCEAVIEDNQITDNIAYIGYNGDGSGGGMFVSEYTTSRIVGNVLADNVAESSGGGLAVFAYSYPVIDDNEILRNEADFGGGVFAQYSSPTITSCLVAENKALSALAGGGGIYLSSSCEAAMIGGNVIRGNQAVSSGGGIYCGRFRRIMNNLIQDNLADLGGGIYCYDLSDFYEPAIVNTTFHGNQASTGGGAIYCTHSSFPEITSSILWKNSATIGPEICIDGAGTPAYPSTVTIRHSVLEGGQAAVYVGSGSTLDFGSGMLDQDPLFVDSTNGDFHLQQDPCQPGVSNDLVDGGYHIAMNMGLDTCSTRTDGLPDVGYGDMGYHYGRHVMPFLEIEEQTFVNSTGGTVNFNLYGGYANRSRWYQIFGSITGTSPGFTLPSGVVLPINWDVFTYYTLIWTNTFVFHNFRSQLSYNEGVSSASMTLPPLTGMGPLTMYFAFTLSDPGPPWSFASNPVRLDLIP